MEPIDPLSCLLMVAFFSVLCGMSGFYFGRSVSFDDKLKTWEAGFNAGKSDAKNVRVKCTPRKARIGKGETK